VRIDETTAALGVHPLTLLLLTYAQSNDTPVQLLVEARMDLVTLGLWTEKSELGVLCDAQDATVPELRLGWTCAPAVREVRHRFERHKSNAFFL